MLQETVKRLSTNTVNSTKNLYDCKWKNEKQIFEILSSTSFKPIIQQIN